MNTIQGRRAGLIGRPVGHSISPQFQQAAFDALGLPVHYELWDTPNDALAGRVQALRAPDFLGANVTIPHKQAAIALVDEVSEDVRLTGAANSLAKRDGRLLAFNTDVSGFQRALRAEMRYDVRGASVGVLGAGGAARAVVLALAREGAARITLLNRRVERARELSQRLGAELGLSIEPSPLDSSAGKRLVGCDLVVNCTSVGLAGSSEAGHSPLPDAELPPDADVIDIVANPLLTPFLQAAAARGRRTLGGLTMLVYQGALAFEIWTGRDAPVDVMMAAAREAMGLAQGRGAVAREGC